MDFIFYVQPQLDIDQFYRYLSTPDCTHMHRREIAESVAITGIRWNKKARNDLFRARFLGCGGRI